MTAADRHNLSVKGAGAKTLMFAHGFGCDQNMWRFVAPAFEHDHRVVLFDHVGAGGTDPAAYDPQKYSSLRGYAGDVLEICRQLNLTDVIFVGHSVSAMIGVLAATTDLPNGPGDRTEVRARDFSLRQSRRSRCGKGSDVDSAVR
ncbi:hypothetical protein BH18ACI5_BH18ACI5_29200 [soil metagenome]